MKFGKLVSAFAAAAVSAAMLTVSAFAETVEIDSEYPGAWTSTGRGITKEQLEAVGGDVKIVLTVETRNLANTADQFLVNPIDYDNGWKSQTIEFCTSDTLTAKTDGWICVRESDTRLEFVYSKDAIADLGDDGLCFSVQNVIVKSAEYTLAEGPQGEMTFVDDKTGKEYCFSSPDEAPAAEETPAPAAEETAPAADSTTTPASTGNTSAGVIAFAAIGAAAAAFAARKR